MAVEKFKIINDDGSTNQSEYERCIQFLTDYTNGLVKVYQKFVWDNAFEVDLSQKKSAFTLLKNALSITDNKLLTDTAFADIKKLFTGILERTGSTIHSCGNYLRTSGSHSDGPGYMYDVFKKDSTTAVLTEKLNDNITIFYLDDDNHTVLEYNDTFYANQIASSTVPNCNYPSLNALTTNALESNITNYPDVYKGNLSGVYSDFQALAGQYVESSTLFYYGSCLDQMYTTGPVAYEDDRLSQVINFNYRASVATPRSIPTRGVPFTLVGTAQNSIINPDQVTGYIDPTVVNPNVNYLSPTFLTSKDPTIWMVADETEIESTNN